MHYINSSDNIETSVWTFTSLTVKVFRVHKAREFTVLILAYPSSQTVHFV